MHIVARGQSAGVDDRSRGLNSSRQAWQPETSAAELFPQLLSLPNLTEDLILPQRGSCSCDCGGGDVI